MTPTEERLPPHRRGWWRRNAIGLAAALILAPATIAVTFNAEWGAYYAERPSRPVAVGADDTAEFAGADWRLDDVERIAASSAAGKAAGLPPGTDLVVTTVTVDPRELDDEGRSPGCLVDLEERRDGAEARTWSSDSAADVGWPLADDASTYCDSSQTGPYRVESTFLVPADAGSAFSLRVQVTEEFPEYLQIELEAPPAAP